MPSAADTHEPEPGARASLADWRRSPFSRWAFHHVRELLPTAEIANRPEAVAPLATAPRDLDGLEVPLPDGTRTRLGAFLEASATDGIVVLHRGRIAFERYANGMTERSPHILMSVTKSMTGLVAGILAARGMLDPDRPVTDYVPEVAATAYAGATVRHLLDMRAGIAFTEDYLATSGAIIEYRKAMGWNELPPGESPSDLKTFFTRMDEAEGPHGGRFRYVSVNSDLLGWVVERAGQARYADLVSALLWQPMGAGEPAYVTVDRLGAPRAAGGLCATTRDLARVGRLLAAGGAAGTRQVVPEGWIHDLIHAGDPTAWASGDFADLFGGADMHYRDKWYVARGARPLVFGLGIHGQNLFVDPAADLVIAKFSSQPAPLDAGLVAATGCAVEAVRRALGGA